MFTAAILINGVTIPGVVVADPHRDLILLGVRIRHLRVEVCEKKEIEKRSSGPAVFVCLLTPFVRKL